MENATKALIIAGGILVAILLISTGVLIYMRTVPVTDAVAETSTAVEISIFNSQFVKYTGNKVSVTNVKSLLNLVAINNARNEDHQITTKLGSSIDNPTVLNLTGKYYRVEATPDDEGYINLIQITSLQAQPLDGNGGSVPIGGGTRPQG